MRVLHPCHVLSIRKMVMVSWELTVPAGVSPSGYNRRELDMGGKLSKNHSNICISSTFPSFGER